MEVSCLDYLFELDEELFSTCAQLITSISYRMCNYFFGNRYMFQGNIAAHVLWKRKWQVNFHLCIHLFM